MKVKAAVTGCLIKSKRKLAFAGFLLVTFWLRLEEF